MVPCHAFYFQIMVELRNGLNNDNNLRLKLENFFSSSFKLTQNKLERSYLAYIFSLVLHFYANIEQEWTTLLCPLYLNNKYQTWVNILATEKRSSLSCLVGIDDIIFCGNGGQCYKTLIY